ncbi:nuclear envelope [Backusella circina FSU 941]|nr:nuclear envelope [Backusella circina FSU 941]
MDKDTLIHIINSILNTHPEVRQNIMSLIPPPTINSSLGILLDMEKQLINSFPYNRNGLARDDYTFSRVREYLMNYIDTITQYAHLFTTCSNIFPTACFSFLDHATQMAHRLPIWDSAVHNSLKSLLYHDLTEFWRISIQSAASKLRENEHYSSDSVNAWAKSLAQHNTTSNGAFTEAVVEFTKQLGFMIGFPNEVSVCHSSTGLETGSTSLVGTGIGNI